MVLSMQNDKGNEEMIFRVWNDERVIFHDGEEMRR